MKCKNCGCMLEDDEIMCGVCGTSVEDEEQKKPKKTKDSSEQEKPKKGLFKRK